MSKLTKIKTIDLSGTKNGIIVVSKLDEPYGEGSNSVASIGISLKGDEENLDWKTHIPIEDLADVIDALLEIK
jgi:uncharacterized NAD-dependent epimerase/dehydratase family protein